MSKIIAWLVLIFIVLFALRVINARKARNRHQRAADGAAAPMVRCDRCGVFLPRTDALPVGAGYTCADGQCNKH
ncbi:MAG: PP0621 family protein [Casimicrobiaceae bacterium]